MAYNPTPDNSAEILSRANNQAAAIQFAGMQSFGNSMGNAMESFADGYAKANENKMSSDYLDKMASYYSTVNGPDGKPLMSQEELEKFSKSSLGGKQGMIVPRQAAYDQMLQNSYLQAQMDSYMKRTGYGAQVNSQVPPNQQPVSTSTGGGGGGVAPNNFNHQNWAAGIKGNQ